MAKKTKKAKKATKTKKSTAKAAKKPVKKAAKPAAGGSNLHSVAAGLTMSDVEKSIAWYRDVLGFTVKQRWENEGKLLGAEMTSGNVTFNLGQDDWKMGRDRLKGAGVRFYITMGPKVDELANQIKARGGTLASEPRDEWGMRTFSVNDPDGYKITYMTVLKK